jgi:predicted patatin/cPLA2 family phospholipase
LIAASLLILLTASGCVHMRPTPSPTAAGIKPTELVDTTGLCTDGPSAAVFQQLFSMAEKVRAMQRPDVLPRKRSVLVLSGGGAYGAYTAGVLCGWTESGTRPEFDVVTGVSTGALISVFAFLGCDYDCELRRLYTTVQTSDIYRMKNPLRAILSSSLADNNPLYKMIDATITPDVMCRLAEAHANGRRLFIGTTDLEGRRPVVWDLGAIATCSNPGSRELVCKLLLASASIPVVFPSVDIPLDVDGSRFVERHVDGGVTQPLFLRLPQIDESDRMKSLAEQFYDSDQYVIVAGKLYADPEPVKPKILAIAGSTLPTFTYAQTRDSLVKLYMQSLLTGMNYHLAAIPNEFPAPTSSTDFDRAKMCQMFEEGRQRSITGTVWRNTPPGVGEGEELILRAGTNLTHIPHNTLNTGGGQSAIVDEPSNLPVEAGHTDPLR